jgi:16S rRNA (guanine527-N7)-methyltransferase
VRLERWLAAVVATPGLTALRDVEEARRTLLEDSVRAAAVVARFDGPIVDVGSGGGAPGIPLAAALPEREVVLLEANARKAAFLEAAAQDWPNVSVVRGRAEEQAVDTFGVAVAKALAPPPVAAEWCLPLVRPGGAAILWVGPTAERERVARVAGKLAARVEEDGDGLLVLRKIAATPAGFPRRTGMARKRPLA